MPICLLAPLPSEHVADSLAAAATTGIVALGTGDMSKENGGVRMFEFFKRIQEEGFMGELPVFLQVSKSGLDLIAPFYVGHYASLSGVLESFDEANGLGQHKIKDERPRSAREGDGPLAGFWRVRDLKILDKNDQIKLSSFKAAKKVGDIYKPGPSIDFIVRGPMLAFSPT